MEIETKEKIINMDIETEFEIFLYEINDKIDEGENKKIFNKVKYGDKIEFDIEELIKDRAKCKIMVKKRNGKEVGKSIRKIEIDGKTFEEKEFEDELKNRKRIMNFWLFKNMTTTKFGEARDGEDS